MFPRHHSADLETLGVIGTLLIEQLIDGRSTDVSLRELLQQGWTNLDAWWISGSVIAAMIITLVTVTFIGEAIREAFDPKLHTVYE